MIGYYGIDGGSKMHVEKMNQIIIAATQGIPEDEVCENDDERLIYRSTADMLKRPSMKDVGYDMVQETAN